MCRLAGWCLILFCPLAYAEPHVLRMATVAPEGTAWARATRAFANDVEQLTSGEVKIKWYFGGIAGDELQVGERMRKEQLDGVASGGMLCIRLAPSLGITRLAGLIQTRSEAAYVVNHLKPVLDDEFRKSGYTNLIEAGLGPDVIFSRAPIRSLADLRRTRLWLWDLDVTMRAELTDMGVTTVPLPLDSAARAYDEGRVDGFIALPTAALAFQWSTQTHYFTELHVGWLSGCLVVADRAFDALSPQAQAALRTAAAKLQLQFEDLGKRQDDLLLDGLFARQGLRPMPVNETFRAEFLAAARETRERLGERVLPAALLSQVLSWLANYRAEHNLAEPR